jgi:4-hydroxy-tetrahydrodipicolinate reductase
MTSIAIAGATGRMGQRLVSLSKQAGDFQLVAALTKPDSPKLGADAGELAGVGKIGVPFSAELTAKPQVLIDFTGPEGMRHWLKVCQEHKVAMVIGSTGLSAADHASIDVASKGIAIIQAPNMSLGVNVLFKIAGQVAALLGDDYDKEIVEMHHRHKKDAPSGTAAGIADSIVKAMGKTKDAVVYGRHGDEALRERGQIGMHSLRAGDEVGKHTVYFGTMGERLELTHSASTRDTFVHGALKAARWVATQKAGRYTMFDMLGL